MKTGDVIAGRFVIERLAGFGGMAIVYRALDRDTGAPVAVKVLQETGVREDARFQAEVKLLSELDHPGIVRFIADGETSAGEPYLAMEWVEGEELRTRLGRGRMGVTESVAVVRAAAEALAVAHARGIIHRDLKPSNLMLTGVLGVPVKLLDFGIARLTQARTALTLTGTMVGTPGYMAPEQARGAEDIDARADVFSLGALLFECLTGRPAFVADNLMAMLAKLLLAEPPRVGDFRADVPADLVDLVERMLAKAREARPRDAAAVVIELDALGAFNSERAPRPPRRAALNQRDQPISCVIVAAEPESAARDTPAVTVSNGHLEEICKRLEEKLVPLGVRVEPLAIGGVVVALEVAEGAADQAAWAALEVRRMLPALPMAMAAGRGGAKGPSAVEHVIDLAGKLLAAGAAPGAGVRIDDATRGLLGPHFALAPDESGWELRGEREIGEENQTLLGRPMLCVGRDGELRLLFNVVEECIHNQVARVVVVTAPSGAGKSRLRRELLQRARQQHPEAEIWLGRGEPRRAGAAFSLIGSAVRDAAGILGGEPLSVQREKLCVKVALSIDDKELGRVASLLGEIAGVPFASEVCPELRAARQSAAALVEHVSRAWEDFVRAETAAHPVLLVLEDIHFSDLPSIELVDRSLSGMRGRPLLVLALGLPEVHERFPRLWEDHGAQEIRLGDLSRRSAEVLVRYALGRGTSPAQVADLVERAAGNAFTLEELIRAVAEGGGEAVPETVPGMVEACLRRLTPEERRVVQAASVFGEAFWQGGLSVLLGGRAESALVESALSTLVKREVIRRVAQSRFPGEAEFAFRHALLREGAYAMLSDGDRATNHKLAAAWLTVAGESDPTVLAEHVGRAVEPSRGG